MNGKDSSMKPKPTSFSVSIRRAALVLVSLDNEEASALLQRMSPREVEAVTLAIENLRDIDPAEQTAALNDFHERMGRTSPIQPVRAEPKPPAKLPDDPEEWTVDQIRKAFGPNQAEDWALALADCEQPVVERILKALRWRDRNRVLRADQQRGPWQLHEPIEARHRIQAWFTINHK